MISKAYILLHFRNLPDPGTDPGTDPGIDPGTDPGVDPGTGEGVPIFALTADQVSFLTDAVILHPGNFAIGIIMDPINNIESMQLIEVSDHGFGWEPVLDYNGQPSFTQLSPAYFANVQDLDSYIDQQSLHPVAFLENLQIQAPTLVLTRASTQARPRSRSRHGRRCTYICSHC